MDGMDVDHCRATSFFENISQKKKRINFLSKNNKKTTQPNQLA
jgi:ribosomal protein L13E